MIHLLLLLALQSTPASKPIAPAATSAPAAHGADKTPLLRLDASGVQAPEQPSLESTAAHTRTDRFTPLGLSNPRGAFATPIQSLVAVRGQEENTIVGIGLVTGLGGTGDS